MKRNALCAMTCLAAATLTAAPAHANYKGYLGQVVTFATNFCPQNTLPADGRLLSLQSYTSLYSLLGTRYGGNGRTDFALPDYSGSTDAKGNPVMTCIVTRGTFPSPN